MALSFWFLQRSYLDIKCSSFLLQAQCVSGSTYSHVLQSTVFVSLYSVWQHCPPRSCMEWKQRYCKITSGSILFCWQHQPYRFHTTSSCKSKWTCKSRKNTSQMESWSLPSEPGKGVCICVLTHQYTWIILWQRSMVTYRWLIVLGRIV